MLCRLFIIAGVICIVTGYIVFPGPSVRASKGKIWPKPQSQDSEEAILLVDPGKLEFTIAGETCDLLEETIKRYKEIITASFPKTEESAANDVNFYGSLTNVQIRLTKPCGEKELPQLDMVESYKLNVTDENATIKSKSIWGMMRGIESFSQLIYIANEKSGIAAINITSVSDYPRFSHRGLLIDTSRHFIPVPYILKTLDAMSYNKLNVFHWHITDDQSFPYESKIFNELSLNGAYHPTMVYSQKDIQNIIEYARKRGIRVMVEFDTPGHTRSWGEGIPILLTSCYSDSKPNGYYGPMNPVWNSTYTFLKQFFDEVVSVFPDEYVHLGGDEVDYDCWESNPEITKFMKKNNIESYSELEEYYIQKLIDIVDALKAKSVVWEEVFVNGVKLPKDTVVHVWKPGTDMKVLKEATEAGHPALLSSCWYLDNISGGGDWQKFYMCEPFSFNGSVAQNKLIKGGEACMWAEVVDDTNVISRVWPRASATAERLWSHKSIKNEVDAAKRLEEHTCRMKKRGIAAQPPNGAGYCV